MEEGPQPPTRPRRIVIGKNDLATVNPSLAAQLADPAQATRLGKWSKVSVEWRCDKGHVWKTSVSNRTSGNGCPVCAGKIPDVGVNDLGTTHPELAAQLVEPLLATSLKAGSHHEAAWRCASGHEWQARVCNRARGVGCPVCSGYTALAGETDLATLNPALAAELIDQSIASRLRPNTNEKVGWRCVRGHEWEAAVSSRTAGRGCPYCAGKRAIRGETDLKTLQPELAAQLVDEALGTELTQYSDQVVGWRCELGHEWEAAVGNRTSGNGCPYCAGYFAIVGETDLKTLAPHLALQLVKPELASELTLNSTRRVRWRCDQGHVWRATPHSRSGKGRGCPECATSGFSQVGVGWMYLLAMPGRRVFKFGITNDLERRLDRHSRQGFTEVVETLMFDHGAEALAAETALLRHAKAMGWGTGMTKTQMPDGWSETLLADDCGEDFTLSGFIAALRSGQPPA